MRISAKAEYACLALGELALRFGGNPVSLKAIAETYALSHPFLMQIFHQLRGGRLVQSVRGASGGYQLARAPSEIRLADVVALIDGPADGDFAIAALPTKPMNLALQSRWHDLRRAERTVLEGITLQDLVHQCPDDAEGDYQI